MRRLALDVLIIVCLLSHLSLAAIESTCKQPGDVTLSFDFGPSQFTGKLLDILNEKKIKAAFHVTVDLFRNLTLTEFVKRAHDEGHTIGIFIPESQQLAGMENYPEDDPNFASILIQQVITASNFINAVTGAQPRYLRFGSKKQLPMEVRRAFEQQLGLTITKARVEIRDENNKMDSIWNSLSKGFANATPQTNSFILRQRDTMLNSIVSVEKIIEFIIEKGYSIVPLPECVPPKPFKQ